MLKEVESYREAKRETRNEITVGATSRFSLSGAHGVLRAFFHFLPNLTLFLQNTTFGCVFSVQIAQATLGFRVIFWKAIVLTTS